MDFSFTEEQEAVRELAGRIFEDKATPARVKEIEATSDRFDRELWADLARANLLGLAVPEASGGAGLGIMELCVLLEQQGRWVAPVPLLPTLVMGALAVAEFGTARQHETLLPRVVNGEVVVTAALAGPGANDPAAATVTATEISGGGWRLEGTRIAVPAAHVASVVLVPARTDTDTLGLFLVPTVGLGLERAETTNREIHSHLHLDGVELGPDAMLGRPDGGQGVVAWILDRALVGLCALQVGVAEEAVRQAAAFSSARIQFGKPLSTFQGVAHKAADAYIDTEAMRATLWQAAWRLSEGADATSEVQVAKWWAAEGGQRVVHATQHLHGGIGADVDYPIHRYFLWGKQLEVTLGGASQQLSRLGQLIADAARQGRRVGVQA